jgi:hypothetical protein
MGSDISTCIVSVAPAACPLDPTVVELVTARVVATTTCTTRSSCRGEEEG